MLLIKLQQIELANIMYILLIESIFVLLINSQLGLMMGILSLLLIKSQQPEIIMGILFLLLIKMHLLSVATSWWLGLEWCMFLCYSGQSFLQN
jgi:hypothetical protein